MKRKERKKKKRDLQKYIVNSSKNNIMSTKFRDVSVCVNRFCERFRDREEKKNLPPKSDWT